MNLLKIRKEANRLAVKNASKIVPIYVFIELILFSLILVSNQMISILLSLFVATLTHAYVVISLKAVDNEQISVKKDAIVGFTGYTRLFPSYFMRKLIVNIVSIILVLPTISLIQRQSGFMMGDVINWIQMIVVSGIEDLSSFSSIYEYFVSPLVVFSFIVASVCSSIISYGLALMPYLVEKQDISWTEAIVKSWRMMDGHKKELFTLRISYIPQMLLIYWTVQLVSSLFSFNLFLSTFLAVVLSLYLPIMLYQPHLEMANALFYKELIDQEENPDLFAL